MTGTEHLDALHRAHRRRARIMLALMGVAVAALVVRAVVGSRGGGLGTVLVVGAVAAGVAAVAMLVMSRTTSDRHGAVRALRPQSEVVEVWGAAGLRAALVAEGVADPPVRRTQGTALTMTVTTAGVELWAGGAQPQKVWASGWGAVERVGEGAGVVANDGAKPAVVLLTRAGNTLVLLPARRPTGSIRTAGVPEVRALVGRLERLRAEAHV